MTHTVYFLGSRVCIAGHHGKGERAAEDFPESVSNGEHDFKTNEFEFILDGEFE